MTSPARKRATPAPAPEGPSNQAGAAQAHEAGSARALPGLAVGRAAASTDPVVHRSTVLGKLKSKINGPAKKAAPAKAGPVKAAPVWGAATPKRNANNAGPKLATSRSNDAASGYSTHLDGGPSRGAPQAAPQAGAYASHLEAEVAPGQARANHYSEVIPADNAPPQQGEQEQGEQEQAEQQDEPSHYNNDPIDAPVGNRYAEVIPVHEAQPQPGEQAPAAAPASGYAYQVDDGPAQGGAPPNHYSEVIPAENGQPVAPQAGEPQPAAGTARKHRAFQVNALGREYGNEKTSVSAHLQGAIAGAVKTVKKYYAWKNQNSYSPADRLDLLARMTNNGINVNDSTPDKVLHDFAVRRHKEELEKLRRQDLDVTDAGILMHTTANGREPYPTANGQPDGDPIVDDRLVKYDETAESQEKTLVEVRGGAVYRSQASDEKGAKVDTANSVTHFSGAGYEIFVVDDKNQIHMASHKLGKYHHSSLLAGVNVSMAGEMKIVAGKIVYMSNKSGHYVPTLTNFIQFLHFLEKDGVPLDFEVALLGGAIGGKFPAKDLVAGKSSAGGNANKDKTYEALKTNAVWKSFVDEFGADAVQAVIEQQGWELFGRDITDKDGNDVDLKLVRRLLKQKLKGGASANVVVDKH